MFRILTHLHIRIPNGRCKPSLELDFELAKFKFPFPQTTIDFPHRAVYIFQSRPESKYLKAGDISNIDEMSFHGSDLYRVLLSVLGASPFPRLAHHYACAEKCNTPADHICLTALGQAYHLMFVRVLTIMVIYTAEFLYIYFNLFRFRSKRVSCRIER